ncbi:MAG TPA: hypothetical protein VE863_04230 [Pyrinomonadaceae bacterium]|jgi:hypothetical protein|nr:hypothetical protein [Pyrinomonadaceae bacterium]
MKRTLFTSLAILALLASAFYAFGDIARPKPSPAEYKYTNAGLTIIPDSGSFARLLISQATWERIKNAAANGGSPTAADSVMPGSSRTIMAGLFMFLAISFAGIWFARSSEPHSRKTIATVLLIATVFGMATIIVRANAGPPKYVIWWNLPQALKDHKELSDRTTVEIVPGDDDNIKLLVPVKK